MIEDQRNTPPLIIRNGLQVPEPFLDLGGVDVELPDEITDPQIHLRGIQSRQPFKLVMYGEKSSLLPELEPLAKRYSADLYVMTGEISDTLMYTMASHAAADGRPLVVLTFSDCDPAGWQMPVSIGRKLQAFKASHYPDLKFEMRRVALTPDHVRAYGLPSTPLKAGELRADKWTASYGVEQTEIDALASLQPDLLRNLAIQMLDHFFDHTLRARCNAAAARWRDEAQSQLVDLIGPERLEAFREEAQAKLESLHEEIAAINEALQIDASDLDLPEFDQPEAEIPEAPDSEPLIDSTWPFPEQCRRLKAAKGYTEGMTR
jgi:hypothetical protein